MQLPFWVSHPTPSEFAPLRPMNYAKLSRADQFIIDNSSINDQKIEWLMRMAVVNRNLLTTLIIFLLLTHAIELVTLITKVLSWFGHFSWLQ